MNTMTLQLPNTYVSIENDEMEYIDGGGGTLTSSITGLGAIAVTMGIFMWNVGSKHSVSSLESTGILTAIVGASLIGSAYITSIEKTAWNYIKINYLGKFLSGGGYYG